MPWYQRLNFVSDKVKIGCGTAWFIQHILYNHILSISLVFQEIIDNGLTCFQVDNLKMCVTIMIAYVESDP